MGTANWHIVKPAKVRGGGSDSVQGEYVDGGDHTTTTTASNLTNGAAGVGSAVTAVKGDRLVILADEAMRVRFGGTAATATAGLFVPASAVTFFEVSASGTVSIIDVA